MRKVIPMAYTVQTASASPAWTVSLVIPVRDVHARDVWGWVGSDLRVLPQRWWAALDRWRPMWVRPS